jgi:hypothetical protein
MMQGALVIIVYNSSACHQAYYFGSLGVAFMNLKRIFQEPEVVTAELNVDAHEAHRLWRLYR